MRIRSPKSHWTGVGRGAASMGLTLDAVTTGNASVDAWIASGFQAAQRKIVRRLREDCLAAVDSNFDFITEKAGA